MITDGDKRNIYYDWTAKGKFPDPDPEIDKEYPAIKEAERHMKIANTLMASVMIAIDQDNIF